MSNLDETEKAAVNETMILFGNTKPIMDVLCVLNGGRTA
jgi:hypothetical protein